jgi:glycosyltransferase involved in cell wall biosynthesis
VRVLFLNPAGFVGGAERLLLDLMASLKHAEPGLTLGLLAATEGPLLERARALGVEAHLVRMPEALASLGDSAVRFGGWRGSAALAARTLPQALPAARHVLELRRALRDFRPDLLHSHGLKMHLLGALCRLRGVPLVWHLHDFIGERPLASRALRALSPRAALAVANSHAVARDARAVLPGLRVETVWNAVDVDHFFPGEGDGLRLDRLAGLPEAVPGTIRIGLVATYALWKGHRVFLEAARLALREAQASLRFYVVGGPLYRTVASQVSREELEALANQLGVRAQVGFVPFQPDPADVYRALDVVVHASTRPEPFGLTIAEAMACGRAVVVSRAGGAAELFTPDVDALGVPPGEAAALAGAIGALAHDPTRRRALGQAARRTATEKLSRERLAREVLALYRQLVA